MKRAPLILMLLLLFRPGRTWSQSEGEWEQREEQAEREAAQTEDDARLVQLEYYRRHPLSVNTAAMDELAELGLLSEDQIRQLINYRRLLGPLISIYELQAVPGWDLETIHQLIPFITVLTESRPISGFRNRFTRGEKSLLMRYGRRFGAAAGDSVFEGAPYSLMLRYRYTWKNQLQWGLTLEKDAGEPLWARGQRGGFDFASGHLFVRNLGIVKNLAAGDFTVCLGQGLLQWQRLAFGAGAASMNIKRQGAVLKPYSSSGENNFHRGFGFTLAHGNWSATGFFSSRKLNANLLPYDSAAGGRLASSLETSGYHRTAAEREHRRNLSLTVVGGQLKWGRAAGYIALNAVHFVFGYPFAAPGKLYDRFGFSGKRLSAASIDFGLNRPGVHWFGELAASDNGAPALLLGALLNPDARVDWSVLFRHMAPGYHSFFSDAFTASSAPANETGLFTGMLVRLPRNWQLEVSLDWFLFPWLRYRVSRPSAGHSIRIQVTHAVARGTGWLFRWRWQQKEQDAEGDNMNLPELLLHEHRDFRMQLSQQFSRTTRLRTRLDWVKTRLGNTGGEGMGFLWFADFSFRLINLVNIVSRLQVYETDGYDARIYTQESDVLYSYGVSAFYGKGLRVYLKGGGQWSLHRSKGPETFARIRYWLRLAAGRSALPEKDGLEPRTGWTPEIKIQVQWLIGG